VSRKARADEESAKRAGYRRKADKRPFCGEHAELTEDRAALQSSRPRRALDERAETLVWVRLAQKVDWFALQHLLGRSAVGCSDVVPEGDEDKAVRAVDRNRDYRKPA
jgi:hypothetical protein